MQFATFFSQFMVFALPLKQFATFCIQILENQAGGSGGSGVVQEEVWTATCEKFLTVLGLTLEPYITSYQIKEFLLHAL